MYEQRRKNQPAAFDQIMNDLGHVRLPMGPHGLTGQAAADRALLTSAHCGTAAKALHRALLSPEHRARAEWFLIELKKEDVAIVSREWDALQRVMNGPTPTRVHSRRRPLTVSVDDHQFLMLESMGPNLSENVRRVLNMYVEVNARAEWLRVNVDPDPSKALAIVLDAAMGVSE